tara:strand:- start:69 stop:302 length:234 start_codon:yes stop_codon:yes gene_type:complete
MELSFKNILVVGLGLIGGSILKTIKELNIPLKVYGLDLDEEVTKKANNFGLINNIDNQIKKNRRGLFSYLFCTKFKF